MTGPAARPSPGGATASIDLSVRSAALCEIADGHRLLGAPVDGDTAYVVLAGTMHMRAGAATVVAGKGSLVLVPSGVEPAIAPHGGAARDVSATRSTLIRRGSILAFDATRGAPATLRVVVGRVGGRLSARLGAAEPVQAPLAGPLARATLAAIDAELAAPLPHAMALVTTLLKTCLLLFVRRMDVDDQPAEAATGVGHRIARALAIIAARPAAAHDVASLAGAAGMSRATFVRHFARHAGASPMAYVTAARLREAAGLLLSSAAPVADVAAACGFASASHFRRTFQQAYGETPSHFRSGIRDAGEEVVTALIGPPGSPIGP